MKRPFRGRLELVCLLIPIGLMVSLLPIDASASIPSHQGQHKKHHKKHTSKLIVLSNDDLPRNGHYVMVPPDPPKLADAAVVPGVPPAVPPVLHK